MRPIFVRPTKQPAPVEASPAYDIRLDRQYIAGAQQGYILGELGDRAGYNALVNGRMKEIVAAKAEASQPTPCVICGCPATHEHIICHKGHEAHPTPERCSVCGQTQNAEIHATSEHPAYHIPEIGTKAEASHPTPEPSAGQPWMEAAQQAKEIFGVDPYEPEEAVNHACGLLDVIKTEWVQEWSEHDQKVRAGLSAILIWQRGTHAPTPSSAPTGPEVGRLVKAAEMARELLQPEVTKEPERTIFWELNSAIAAFRERIV